MNRFVMKKQYIARHIHIEKQRGLVLFVALIALVAMSLAAAALVRSVDSGVLVAGNLAFKQSAIMSAESGIAQAYRYINENSSTLSTGTGANGYYATFNDGIDLKSNSTWSTARDVPASLDDKTGNDAKYIIQRMCTVEAMSDDEMPEKCMVGAGNARAKSKGALCEGGGSGCGGYGGPGGGKNTPVYRVTVRVTGPKNTVSYLQAFLY